MYSVWENLAAENHEDVKHNSIFVAGHYNRKNDIFPFADILSLISFLKKILRNKNSFERFSKTFVNSVVNNVMFIM